MPLTNNSYMAKLVSCPRRGTVIFLPLDYDKKLWCAVPRASHAAPSEVEWVLYDSVVMWRLRARIHAREREEAVMMKMKLQQETEGRAMCDNV